jgi:hypothetical protein
VRRVGDWCEMAISLGVGGFSEVLVGEWVRGLLQFSPCELLLLEAANWGTGTVGEPRGRTTFAVGSRYQKTGEDTAGWEDLSVCSSEL